MTIELCPARFDDGRFVWRDVAGEVVIAERDTHTIRVLNQTASLIWTLADGSTDIGQMVNAVAETFDVDQKEAGSDVDEFCRQLLEAGLVSLKGSPQS